MGDTITVLIAWFHHNLDDFSNAIYKVFFFLLLSFPPITIAVITYSVSKLFFFFFLQGSLNYFTYCRLHRSVKAVSTSPSVYVCCRLSDVNNNDNDQCDEHQLVRVTQSVANNGPIDRPTSKQQATDTAGNRFGVGFMHVFNYDFDEMHTIIFQSNRINTLFA